MDWCYSGIGCCLWSDEIGHSIELRMEIFLILGLFKGIRSSPPCVEKKVYACEQCFCACVFTQSDAHVLIRV